MINEPRKTDLGVQIDYLWIPRIGVDGYLVFPVRVVFYDMGILVAGFVRVDPMVLYSLVIKRAAYTAIYFKDFDYKGGSRAGLSGMVRGWWYSRIMVNSTGITVCSVLGASFEGTRAAVKWVKVHNAPLPRGYRALTESYFVWAVHDSFGGCYGLEKLVVRYNLHKFARGNLGNRYFWGPGFPLVDHELGPIRIALLYLRALLSSYSQNRQTHLTICGNVPFKDIDRVLLCIDDALEGIHRCMYGEGRSSFRHPELDRCIMEIVKEEVRGDVSTFLCGIVICRKRGVGEYCVEKPGVFFSGRDGSLEQD